MTGEFPAQRASDAVSVFIWWRHHATITDEKMRQELLHKTPRIECQHVCRCIDEQFRFTAVKVAVQGKFVNWAFQSGTSSTTFVWYMIGVYNMLQNQVLTSVFCRYTQFRLDILPNKTPLVLLILFFCIIIRDRGVADIRWCVEFCIRAKWTYTGKSIRLRQFWFQQVWLTC